MPHAVPPRRIVAALLLASGLAAAATMPAQARLDAARTARLSVAFTQKPSANTRSTTAVFRWKRTGLARAVTCRLDSAPFRVCKGGRATFRNLAEGPHRFTVRVRRGRVVRSARAAWRVDVTAPAVPASVTGGSLAWGTAGRTLTAAGSSDAGGSGLAGYQFRLSRDGGASWSGPQLRNPVTVDTAGETLVQFRALDKANNASAWTSVPVTGEATVRIDRQAPSAPLPNSPSAGWQDVASLDVTADGSADTGGSGLAGYSYRLSADGGATWSAEADGAVVTVTAEGVTLVKFRAHDGAGNVSPWTKAAVRIDRTAPSDPVVAGGSPAWLGTTSVLVSASGSTDDPGSGVAGYERQTSTDGGTTWTPAVPGAAVTVAAEGETLVRFRAVDASGLPSGWVQATVRLDRTAPAVPVVSGGGSTWQNAASIDLAAAGSADALSGIAAYEVATSTDGGSSWSAPVAGAASTVVTEGETLVRFRAVDNAGNASGWAGGMARIDRSAPSDPAVSGGSLAWLNLLSVDLAASGSTDAWSGVASYELSSSTDGGTTWSSPVAGAGLSVTAPGETLVRFRAVDGVGLTSGWVQATARIDRTAPTAPVITGGSLSWLGLASSTVTGAGSTDAGGSGLAGYEHRVSTDGGATFSAPVAGAAALITAEGETLVQVRALDGAGNASPWTPGSATAGSTVRLDRTDPSAPVLSGGGSAWTNALTVNVSASGATDAASGIARYEFQISANLGVTWAPAIPTAGAGVSVTAAGETLVRFRAVDMTGRVSPWTQTQVRTDRTAPSAPTVTGGSLTWANAASRVISASGSTDAGGATLAGYEYRTSTNGGAWTAAAPGATAAVTVEGTTLVQFRSVDGAGNASAWVPSASGASNTVRLDRTAPSVPTVTGGAGATSCSRWKVVKGSGSTDLGSGVVRYEYRTSSNNGATWGATTVGSSVLLRKKGVWIVQFRAVDGVGLTSAWGPATAGTANTACIK